MATLAMFFRKPVTLAAARASAVPPESVRTDSRYYLRALPNEDIFLHSKAIDNSKVVRAPQPAAHGEWSMIGTAGVLAVLFMGLMTPRVANIFAGYQLQSLKEENQRLLDEQRDLNLVESRLTREENLAALAQRGAMSKPGPGQLVHLDPKADSKLALNRH
ncbi:MAG: hypothetical protein ACLP59_28065 [Bryobacteraceae bacterium]